MTGDVAVLAGAEHRAAPLLASLRCHGIAAHWFDPRLPLAPCGAAEVDVPPVWLLLEPALLPAARQAQQRLWLKRGEPPGPSLLLLVDPPELHRALDFLMAGASDVWSRAMPEPLLLSRLQSQLQLRRQERALARRLCYERAVAEAARLLVGRGPLDQHLQRVVEILQAASAGSRAYVFRNHRDPDRGLCVSQVHEACGAGIEPQIHNPQLQDQPFASDAPNALALLAAGEPFVGRVEALPEPERTLLSSQDILSVLILPIVVGGEFWGFMGFDDCEQARPWHPDDIALLRIVAETTGMAIERQEAEADLLRLAIRDPLTGLHNRRYLMDQFDALVSQGRRDQVRFAVALLDIDWFKRINDGYGHLAGDQVLRHFAQVLRCRCRSYDLVGRYGGEEFLLVALHADAVQLARRLEELRRELHRGPVRYADHTIPVTFSAGIADSADPELHLSVEGLIALVDRRLYRAKQMGRDRLVASPAAAAL